MSMTLEIPGSDTIDETKPVFEAADAANPRRAPEANIMGIIELVLKDHAELDSLLRDERWQTTLIPRFLLLGLLGFAVFGVMLSLAFSAGRVWPALEPIPQWLDAPSGSPIRFTPTTNTWLLEPWLDGRALCVVIAYSFGMVATIGVCLPGYYFYMLLAGVRTNMLEITAHAMKGIAVTAVALVGILPIYLAVILGVIVLNRPDEIWRILWLGLALPFVAGSFGVRSHYLGFMRLADTMPADRGPNREVFLRRLMLVWCGKYTMVCPVMIYTVWSRL